MVQTLGSAVQLTMFTCDWCGKALPKGRADMRCHKECRGKLYRWKKRIERLTAQTEAMIEEIALGGALPFQRETTIEQLKSISATLSSAYAKNNIRRVS